MMYIPTNVVYSLHRLTLSGIKWYVYDEPATHIQLWFNEFTNQGYDVLKPAIE